MLLTHGRSQGSGSVIILHELERVFYCQDRKQHLAFMVFCTTNMSRNDDLTSGYCKRCRPECCNGTTMVAMVLPDFASHVLTSAPTELTAVTVSHGSSAQLGTTYPQKLTCGSPLWTGMGAMGPCLGTSSRLLTVHWPVP